MWVRTPAIATELQIREVGSSGITNKTRSQSLLILVSRGKPTGFRHIELRGNSIVKRFLYIERGKPSGNSIQKPFVRYRTLEWVRPVRKHVKLVSVWLKIWVVRALPIV